LTGGNRAWGVPHCSVLGVLDVAKSMLGGIRGLGGARSRVLAGRRIPGVGHGAGPAQTLDAASGASEKRRLSNPVPQGPPGQGRGTAGRDAAEGSCTDLSADRQAIANAMDHGVCAEWGRMWKADSGGRVSGRRVREAPQHRRLGRKPDKSTRCRRSARKGRRAGRLPV
jgi:hypothetical protein